MENPVIYVFWSDVINRIYCPMSSAVVRPKLLRKLNDVFIEMHALRSRAPSISQTRVVYVAYPLLSIIINLSPFWSQRILFGFWPCVSWFGSIFSTVIAGDQFSIRELNLASSHFSGDSSTLSWSVILAVQCLKYLNRICSTSDSKMSHCSLKGQIIWLVCLGVCRLIIIADIMIAAASTRIRSALFLFMLFKVNSVSWYFVIVSFLSYPCKPAGFP